MTKTRPFIYPGGWFFCLYSKLFHPILRIDVNSADRLIRYQNKTIFIMGLFKKEKPEADKLVILGKEIKCPICEGDKFRHRSVLLNSPGMSMLGLDWLNKEAATYTCSHCHYMMHFNFNA